MAKKEDITTYCNSQAKAKTNATSTGIEMKPLGFFKHLFCYITLGIFCGWYYILLILYPVLIYQSIVGSFVARVVLTTLIVLSFTPLSHKHSPSFVNSFVFRWWGDYFDFSFEYWSSNGKPKVFQPDQRHMFLEFPHGIMPMGQILSVVLIDELTHGGYISGIGADAIFKFPIMRQFWSLLGCYPASRKYISKIFKLGYHCAVTPGGIAEMFLINDDNEVLYFKKRQNTVKAAIQEGAHIIPMFFFGNTKIFNVIGQNKSSESAKKERGNEPFLSKLSRKLKASIVFFYGRNYLPVPYRHPIKLVAGEAIPVVQSDDPSDDYVNEVQTKVIESLQKMWDEKKPSWETRSLVIS